MTRFVVSRVAQGLVTVAILAVMIFLLTRVTGDPASLIAAETGLANQDEISAELGLDRPLGVQFATYMRGLVTGDLGTSFRFGQPVTDVFFDRFGNTLQLLIPAFIVAIVVSVPLGVIAARHRGRSLDRITSTLATLGIATPPFWFGLVLIMIFSGWLGLLPSARMGGWQHYVLPVVTLSTAFVAGMMRLLRSSMLDELSTEYVKLARIKGVRERTVVWRHALRNSLIPTIQFFGTYAALVITGTVTVETVFAWPGTGRLLYESVLSRDFPVAQGIIIIGGILIVLITFAADVITAWLDPRIR